MNVSINHIPLSACIFQLFFKQDNVAELLGKQNVKYVISLEKIISIYITDKRLISRVYKELLEMNITIISQF